MEQLILHLFGDYVTQSDWMAQNKTKQHSAALAHALVYSLPFLLIGTPVAALVIFATHFLIDRYRLARYVAWAKNFIAPRQNICPNGCNGVTEGCSRCGTARNHRWKDCSATGYHKDSPAWLSVWLMIACDNTLHLAINYAAIRWL